MCIPIVSGAVELFVRGDVRVYARPAEDIAGDDGLGSEMVPKLQWKMGVSSAETTDEVILECLDGSFGCVDTMIVRFDELDRSVVSSHVVCDGCCGLVICDVERRLVTLCRETAVHLFECMQDVGVGG